MSYLHREYPHRYKVLSGPNEGLVSTGEQIGYQDYPGQFQSESFTSDQISKMSHDKFTSGMRDGIWLYEQSQAIYLPVVRSTQRTKVEITDEGVNYDDVYMDLCVPFDRYGNEIKVGDTIMIASKNEVRRVKVSAIAKKPYMASYGIMNRKLTVRDDIEEQTLTINDPRATVKI